MVCNGELIAQIAEERLDRRKHSNSPELPVKAIYAVLEIAGLRKEKIGSIGISYTNVIIDDIIEQLAAEILDLLKLPSSVPVYGIGHHDCHAWSAYYTSNFNKALIIVADGAGDIVDNRIEAESIYFAEGSHLKLIARRLQDFGLTRMTRRNAYNLAYMSQADRIKQISLGRKYEQFTYLIGFGHGHSGKTMALASYADPLFIPEVPALNDLQFSLKFEDGLVEIDKLWKSSGKPWHQFVSENAKSIAATAQAMLEAYMIKLIKNVDFQQSDAQLCAAGGVFLNCQLNHRIIENTNFNKLHVTPAAGDDGQCIGAAYAAYAKEYEPPKRSSASLPYLGRRYSKLEIEERLRHFKLHAEQLDDKLLIRQLVDDIAEGRIIGFLRGRSETGPRALCHRSFLADPRRAEMKERLNLIKRRELFRPFAPVVTADAQFRYFALKQESRFMLLAATVLPEYRASLPAITHIDGTARVQAITKKDDVFVYALLKEFEARTGFPILLNTSFNVAGEPMVESPHDAIVTFLNSDIEVLVMENYYVKKRLKRNSKSGFRKQA